MVVAKGGELVCLQTGRAYSIIAALIVSVFVSSCTEGHEGTAGVLVKPPEALVRGKKVEARVTALFHSASEPLAGTKVDIRVEGPADVIVDPAVSQVVLDKNGSGEVIVYLQAANDASEGKRTFRITATTAKGRSASIDFEVAVINKP